jgi:hypothetical protein
LRPNLNADLRFISLQLVPEEVYRSVALALDYTYGVNDMSEREEMTNVKLSEIVKHLQTLRTGSMSQVGHGSKGET